MRRAVVAFVALGLVVMSCRTATTPAQTGGPTTVTYDVQVDASTTAFNIATVAYFPNELKAHPGDTIRFTSVDRGEPHTVTFGSLIDDALAALAKVPKDAPPGPPPSAVLKIPPAIAGQLPNSIDFRQSAMQSCFLASGEPPARDACSKEQQKQPEFTGTQTFFNTGFLPGRSVFALKIANNIKPGTYNFICLFHGPEMNGKVVVVDAAEPTPSPEEIKAKGAERLNGIVKSLQSVVNDAKAKAAAAPEVIAGAGDPTIRDALSTDFFPKTVGVSVGSSVTWRIITGHTISFNAPSDAVDLVVKATDGSFHLNNKSVFPVAWPGAPLPPFPGMDPAPGAPPPQPPSDAVPPPFSADAGAWDGKGFRSSGIIFQFDPRQSVTYKVTFAQPGTYTYKCLIHVDMDGTVNVRP
ncbi:MAG TPA: hypothetical protein VGR46_09360 [Candidatus Limnocylindria bacterium]|nr:hypothetical protein [Candidatus Limnocylindria bacterium]HEV8671413.1 hypothetical protein [Candidatus Limnocylindria bacterium]